MKELLWTEISELAGITRCSNTYITLTVSIVYDNNLELELVRVPKEKKRACHRLQYNDYD
jgi:hypothetical protein